MRRTQLEQTVHLLIALPFTWVAGCGDDGGAEAGDQYTPLAQAAQSDGSPGGDLAALQYRLSEVQCACAADLADFCVEGIWGDDGLMCLRDAYNAHASSDAAGIPCFEEVVRQAIDCFRAADCDDGPARQACFDAYESGVDACPPASAQLADDGLECIGHGAWAPSDGDVWLYECSSGDDPAPDFLHCDGNQDCDDGSDELNCAASGA